MNNFADIKRKLIVGQPLKCLRNDFSDKYVGKTRKIEKMQTNAIKFEGGSRLGFPKAKYVEVINENTFSLVEGTWANIAERDFNEGKRIVYQFVTNKKEDKANE
tara:strand:- start:291 stop:602 length:312 start_codon:yes stop_codon:yes gene_type:complete